MKRRSKYTGISPSSEADGELHDEESSSPATSSQSAYQSTSSMPAARLAPTSKVVTALRHGDLEVHIRNFGRHLRRPSAEDQAALDQLLDGLDDLSSVDQYLYCRIVQRLGETLLEHCLGYLCSDIGNPDVCLHLKTQSVLRILWMTCLYNPSLQRIAQAGVELIPMMNRLILSCLRTSDNLRENKANNRHEERERKISRESVSSASDELVLSSYSMSSVVVSALAISYNCLFASWDREVIVVCCQCGFIRTVVSLLSRTRNIIIGEICLRILGLMGESGGNTCKTLLKEYQVMKEASRLWHYMVRRDLITKSGFLVAGLIAQLGENLRQGDGVYMEWAGSPGTAGKRNAVFRTPHLKMIRWCSSPGCGRSEELKTGRKFRLCSRCRLSRYCSEDCQRFHWNRGHKVECFPVLSRDHSLAVNEDHS